MNDSNSPCEDSQDCCDESLYKAEESSNLLAYADVPEDVDEVFKAFLDTRLLEMAYNAQKVKNPDRPFVYWEAVIAFRRETLGVREQPQESSKGSRVEVILEQARRAKSANPQDGLQEYLFWFDVRALYWSLQLDCDLEKLASTLLPSEYLARLAAAVVALQKRIEKTFPSRPPAEVTPPVGGTSGRPSRTDPSQQFIDLMNTLLGLNSQRETGASPPKSGEPKAR